MAVNKKLTWTVLATILGLHLAALATFIGCSQGYEAPQPNAEQYNFDGGWGGSSSKWRLRDRRIAWNIPQEWKAAGEGKTRLLYQDYEKVHGHPYEPRSQGKSPSCVGQAVAAASDFLAAVEINTGERERAPPAGCDAGIVYGLSRVEIGQNQIMGGGSHNLWACQALQKYGVVPMVNYPLLGIDLSEFDAARAIQYGRDGCPDSLEPIAQLHPVRDYIAINSYEDLRDALYYGCPCVVGSAVGFGAKSDAMRDSEGFLSPPRRVFFKSVWRHSMAIIAVCDEGRQGVLILNSWGPDWISGPKRFGDEPEGSFWVDREVIERMIAAGDCYAIRDFAGYAEYNLWK